MSEPRKISDVVLELESKINSTISYYQNIDLSVKLISNKMNDITSKLNEIINKLNDISTNKGNLSNKIVVEAINNISQPTVAINKEEALPVENVPTGFRRTSRPETFSGDDVYLKQSKQVEAAPQFPVQIPKGNHAEIVVPQHAADLNKREVANPLPFKNNAGQIPIVQRVVDKNGKSVFLADVEIINAENNDSVFKTRTNGVGKWMASLPLGAYRVNLRKREPLTKTPVEVVQNIQVDGTKSPFELQTVIINI